ncbi:DUF4430 domain-containing protein [Erysipelatoclostridium sp. AM42-17]|uniref:DUF4430 domain-containing protein n=1 Tax=Erysipelatoclostridium sp. AM42-17 TaxID=2293102 RepID=UPI000E4D2963|nr:DUF4430 domain-containing protein [Erysipelatoclostridium sp. AM42-17]RHS95849.1 DUF4430 domain-containing protein [Erysipelatoclostridium sp. AM42-17]
MKKLVNKFKALYLSKRIVIIFITISFVFIGGFSFYNGITGNYQNQSIVQKDTISQKNTKKKKEKKEDTNQQENEESKNVDSQSNVVSNEANQSTSKSTTSSSSNKSNEANKSSHSETSTSQNNQVQSGSQSTNNNQSNHQSTSQTPNEEAINVSIQVYGMGNLMMSGNVNVEKGTSVYDVLTKVASQNGLGVYGSKIYVKGIGDLFEKQHGNMSGWMYSVNGVFPNKSCGYYSLENNDKIVWRYVNYN